MPDLYGAQSIPLSVIGTPLSIAPSVADPILTYLGSYLKTVANARLAAQFGAISHPNASPSVSVNPIEAVLEHDPEQYEFNDSHLPALFVFRNGESRYELDVANDWRISTGTLTALWVLPGAVQSKQAAVAAFASKLFHLFDAAIECNRDKSWIVNGDSDPVAAREGSQLGAYTKHHWLKMGRWRRKTLLIQVPGKQQPVQYQSFEGELELRERIAYDPAHDAAFDGIDVDINTIDAGYGDGGLLLGEEDFDV